MTGLPAADPIQKNDQAAHAKRVLFVIPDLSNGGAERAVVQWANGLAELGLEVGILTFRGGGDYAASVRSGVKVLDIGMRTKTVLEKIRAAWKVAAASRDYDYVVSGLELRTDDIVIGAKMLNRLRGSEKKYIAAVHIAVLSYPLFLKKRFGRRWWKAVYSRFDRITAVSKGVAGDVAELTGVAREKIDIIPAPTDIKTLGSKADEPVDVANYQPYFVAVGRLEEQKDYPTLIRAFRRFLDTSGSDHNLLILGRGSQEDHLHSIVESLGLSGRVHLKGFVANPWAYVKRSTALVLSSIYEGLALAITEAMACGTPVIAVDCPYGPKEMIDGGRNGYLVRMRDPESIARAMVRVASHPGEALEKAANAARFVEQFDVREVGKRLHSILLEL